MKIPFSESSSREPAEAFISAAASSGTGTPASENHLALPAIISPPPAFTLIPLPGTASTESGFRCSMLRSRAYTRTASAKGCSELASVLSSSDRNCGSLITHGRTAETFMRPSVSVPVLSKIITSIFGIRSSTSALLINIPSSAARPKPTETAIGTARPMAQGQATASTAAKTLTARGRSA